MQKFVTYFSVLGFLSFGLNINAQAGGLERAGYNIDLLFDPSPYVSSMTTVYVTPNRVLKNVTLLNSDSSRTSSVSESVNYLTNRFGLKIGFSEQFDCLADYSEPWGAHTKPGKNWVGASNNVETKISSKNIGTTCSLKYPFKNGNLRFISGLFYQELHGFKETFFPKNDDLLFRLSLSSSGYGWRAGLAYERPEIAFRASLVYNSQVNLSNIIGTIKPNYKVPTPNGNLNVYIPVYGSAIMPQSLELKVQSAISENSVVFGSLKWVNWSVLQSIPFCQAEYYGQGGVCSNESASKKTSLDLLYRDGWTISGGMGRKLSQNVNGALSLSWDRGTSTGFGTLTDVLSLGGQISFSPQSKYEISLGGAVGVLTKGKSLASVVGRDGKIYNQNITYDFDNDLFAAFTASLKIKI